ncbi:ALG6/ALG8 glycosyltransferase [Chloropicon primus]|uniref:Alpha-1,3-glucosyltransferase n=1 Tax=Chloropicon primus TaxID=1764295 RepID=A0A5B8MEM4_9CHLO|nr:ALG6/ALG8 glycosyltransferase [Chloropicon primus]UPQ96997.1 ALG6/ALG8 glycosyltransferase [Chloropicon primus]|eukprot:QDZ17780.1 ALG6/ALG8 glycosyltransferase [Chloropicon primus]
MKGKGKGKGTKSSFLGGARGGVTPVAACVLAFAFALKVLLFPAYRSTDFEVHRNWLAVTHSLPLAEWYVDETSEWTLDYPPLFAWFEYLLSLVAALVDPEMLVVSNLSYASEATIAFQRASVIATESVLILAAYLFCRRAKRGAFGVLAFLIALNPGLLIVDHIHFQYNGLLLGIFMLSLEALQRENVLLSALLFSVLLNMKHLFAVAGPYFFVYMLRRYCFLPRGKFSFGRFLLLGLVVASVCGLSLGPFVLNGTIGNLLGRLFPFGRGLCHAYWAPNFWALYSAADKVLVKLARLVPGLALDVEEGNLAGGLVGVAKFGVLPQITPTTTLVLVVLSMAPCLVRTWRNPKPANVLRDVAYVNLCGFMFGYHVHEKAVLHFIIPMAFSAVLSKSLASDYARTSWPAYISLLPLLFRPEEQLLKQLVVAFHCIIVTSLSQSRGRRRTGKGSRASALYVPSLVGLQVYTNFHQVIFGSKYAFLPLLLMSVSSSLGLFHLFCRQFWTYVV